VAVAVPVVVVETPPLTHSLTHSLQQCPVKTLKTS
jgi:hypothetical protein